MYEVVISRCGLVSLMISGLEHLEHLFIHLLAICILPVFFFFLRLSDIELGISFVLKKDIFTIDF